MLSLWLIFVPNAPQAPEDDGVLLGFVYDSSTDRSNLAISNLTILDAASLEILRRDPPARPRPLRIPRQLGTHTTLTARRSTDSSLAALAPHRPLGVVGAGADGRCAELEGSASISTVMALSRVLTTTARPLSGRLGRTTSAGSGLDGRRVGSSFRRCGQTRQMTPLIEALVVEDHAGLARIRRRGRRRKGVVPE
jgi:hypothetical protein